MNLKKLKKKKYLYVLPACGLFFTVGIFIGYKLNVSCFKILIFYITSIILQSTKILLKTKNAIPIQK